MALDKDRLGAAIAAHFTGGGLSGAEEQAIEDAWKIIAQEIIDEFKNNADITAQSGQTCNATGTTPPHPTIISDIS